MKTLITSTSRAIVMMAVLAFCFSSTAQAQEKPLKHRGPVISVDVAANTITIDHKKKGELTLKLAPDAKIKPKSVGGLGGIKPGTNVICYSPANGGDVMAVRVREDAQ